MKSDIIKIAHRGNWRGKLPEKENNPDYINEAINLGYHVEVDVWFKNGNFYLGHDDPQWHTDSDFLSNPRIICHCKNIEALHKMLESGNIHCFWHQRDDYTLTSEGWVWKYPEAYKDGKLIGICSDWL
jgi:hypothetical protein